MKHPITAVRARRDQLRGTIRRRRAGTHLLEEMSGHPERVRDLPDPAAVRAYWDIAQGLLDDGMAQVIERAGWFR
jgi:hypothetical protein